MTLDLFAGFLEIAGQPTGGRCQQPEQEESNTVDTHATDFRLTGYHQQIKRIESRKKQAGGNTGGEKGWPEHRDNTLYYGYFRPVMLHVWIYCGFHGLRPRR